MSVSTKLNYNYHLRLTKPYESTFPVSTPGTELTESGFTEREVDILQQMADGLTAGMIADKLHISPHTVKTHQRNMLKKSGCYNGTQLVAQCIRRGII